MPSLPTGLTQVTKTGNVGSVEVFRTAHLFTFGRRGAGCSTERVMNGLKKSAKNRGTNGMPSLPTWPAQITKTGNEGSVDVFRTAHLFTFGRRGQVLH